MEEATDLQEACIAEHMDSVLQYWSWTGDENESFVLAAAASCAGVSYHQLSGLLCDLRCWPFILQA